MMIFGVKIQIFGAMWVTQLEWVKIGTKSNIMKNETFLIFFNHCVMVIKDDCMISRNTLELALAADIHFAYNKVVL